MSICSMEECEALCTRITIMANGRFVCLGSPQHLRSKFGQGYTLEAKMATQEGGNPAPVEPLVAHVQQHFPSAKLFDSHDGYAHMQVPDPSVRVADIFAVMEEAKDKLEVEQYGVHQTNLEQVFLAFTSRQSQSKDSGSKGLCSLLCCRS